jgi:hypothetical protein
MPATPNRGPARPIAQVLATDPELARWLTRARQHERIHGVVASRVPAALATSFRVVETVGSELVLGAATGAASLALRRDVRAILSDLRRGGFDFQAIRVLVLPRLAARDARPGFRAPAVGPEARQAMCELAARLPEGTLQVAVSRLASALAARQGDGRQS